MSSSLFENPKIALGFAGVVVAVALVASVALDGISSDDPDAQQTAQTEQTPPSPVSGQQAQSAATGWASEAGVSGDWGAPSASSQNDGFARPAPQTDGAPVWGDSVSKKVSGGGIDRSSAPTITTSAAPGAPEVVPPSSGRRAQIEVVGN